MEFLGNLIGMFFILDVDTLNVSGDSLTNDFSFFPCENDKADMSQLYDDSEK